MFTEAAWSGVKSKIVSLDQDYDRRVSRSASQKCEVNLSESSGEPLSAAHNIYCSHSEFTQMIKIINLMEKEQGFQGKSIR